MQVKRHSRKSRTPNQRHTDGTHVHTQVAIFHGCTREPSPFGCFAVCHGFCLCLSFAHHSLSDLIHRFTYSLPIPGFQLGIGKQTWRFSRVSVPSCSIWLACERNPAPWLSWFLWIGQKLTPALRGNIAHSILRILQWTPTSALADGSLTLTARCCSHFSRACWWLFYL